MGIEKFAERAIELIKNNKDILIKATATVGLGVLAYKLKLPVSLYGREIYSGSIGDPDLRIPFGADSTERAIISIANSAMKMDFDSQKKDLAKKIVSLALSSSSEDTKSTAINCLERISNEMDFDSTKKDIGEFIFNIASKKEKA